MSWLTKPVKPSRLFDTLVALLAQSGGPPIAPAEPTGASTSAPAGGFDREMAIRHPLRILLAEDNVLNQRMALQILARLGYTADVVGNGVEALAAIEVSSYDVVLLDVQMPEMDGLETARRVCRSWPLGQRPELVAMTANAMTGDREECLAAGMDDYVSKRYGWRRWWPPWSECILTNSIPDCLANPPC